jgi:hypothetical protein
MLKNVKKEFNRDYRVKLTPGKFRIVCEIDWPSFGIGWPSEGSLYEAIVNRAFEVVVGEPEHPDQFPYINCWKNAALSQPTWLKPHLGKVCRIMRARTAAASKCREKCKKPEKLILVGAPRRPYSLMCHCTPSFMEKLQALIDLMQSIIQTRKSTWIDCLQLL